MYTPVTFSSLQQSLFAAAGGVLTTLIAFIPQLLGALLVFLVGVYLSRWSKSLLITLLRAINLSNLVKGSPIDKFLEKADIRLRTEEILGEALRWLILYIFIIASVNVIGLVTVGDFLTSILQYVPNVIAAMFILTVGVLAAGFTESIVKSTVAGFDPSTGRFVGRIASYTVVVFASLVAIGELGIAQTFINTLFTGFVAMLALGLGLAFGLGAKDVVNQMLTNWYQEFTKASKKK